MHDGGVVGDVDYQLLNDDGETTRGGGDPIGNNVVDVEPEHPVLHRRAPYSGWTVGGFLSALTGGGLIWYVAIVCFVFSATQGALGTLMLYGTPANFVYVFLTQLTLLVWLIATICKKWEVVGIPYEIVLEPRTPSNPYTLTRKSDDPLNHETLLMSDDDTPITQITTTATQIATIAASFTALLGISVITYVGLCWKEGHDQATSCISGSPIVIQFLGIVLVLGLFCVPAPLPMWPARKRLVWRLMQCFSAVIGWPVLGKVEFIHIILTDTLTSTSLLLWQFEFSLCLFFTTSWVHVKDEDTADVGGSCVTEHSTNREFIRPMIAALPFWLRMWQCISVAVTYGAKVQYLNAIKYFSAVCVVMTSASTVWDENGKSFWFKAWVFALCMKTILCYSWDVLMDWGLVWRLPTHGTLLREKYHFHPLIYKFAMVFNFFARISWSLAISPAFCHKDCVLALGLVEMLRRTVWILLRVELAFIEGPNHATAQGKNDIEAEKLE